MLFIKTIYSAENLVPSPSKVAKARFEKSTPPHPPCKVPPGSKTLQSHYIPSLNTSFARAPMSLVYSQDTTHICRTNSKDQLKQNHLLIEIILKKYPLPHFLLGKFVL